MIDEDLFARTQEKIKKRSKIGVKLNHIGRMLIDRGTNQHLYFSRSKDAKSSLYFKRINGLQQYKIQSQAMEGALYLDAIDMIQNCCHNTDRLYEFYKKRIFNNEEFNKEKLKFQLKELNGLYEKLLEIYFAGKIPQEEFETEAKKYSSKIKKVEKLLEGTDEQMAKIDVFNLTFKKFLDKLKEIPMYKYKLIQMVISKVYINSPPVDNEFDITIVYKFEE